LIPLTDVEGSPTVAKDIAGVIVQYPNTEGKIYNLENLIKTSHENGALVIMVCDLLSLTLLKSPGDLGADIAVGNAQRFGLPLGYGGPHPAFMAVAKRDEKNSLARTMPGRIVGVSKLVYKVYIACFINLYKKSSLNSVPWINSKKLDAHGLMVRTLTIHVIIAGGGSNSHQ
jgi:glycine cleavage system protein P-like pyridoxal-binding family